MILLSKLSGLSITSPRPWSNKFSECGFGGFRTGWSNSLFLFVPFLVYQSVTVEKNKSKYVFAFCIIIVAQFLSGGRAGMLASLFSVVYFYFANLKKLIIPIFLVIIVLFSFYDQIEKEFMFAMRMDQERLKSKSGADNLDKISSKRMEGYEIGIDLLASPNVIFGYGVAASQELTDRLGYGADIHNTWLKRLINNGLIYTLIISFLFLRIFKMSKGSYFLIVFIGGFFIMQIEPNYILGSFQGESFFWAQLGLLYKTKEDE